MPEQQSPPNLAAKICLLMEENHASLKDGMSAIMTALVIGLIDSGAPKEASMEWFSASWDRLAVKMKEDRGDLH